LELLKSVSSKPSLSMLDQYSEIIKSNNGQGIVARDDQTLLLKLSSSQKTVLYEVDFSGPKKFCLD